MRDRSRALLLFKGEEGRQRRTSSQVQLRVRRSLLQRATGMKQQSSHAPRRALRVVGTGWMDQKNEVLVSTVPNASCNVIYFPGDIQNFSDAMMEGSHAEFADYAYEAVAGMLVEKFGQQSTVWVVQPSRFEYGAFSCFDHFVCTNKFGCATSYPSSGCAVKHLQALMRSVQSELCSEEVIVSTTLPLYVVGFSKGVVVLNQLLAEVAASIPDEQNSSDNNEEDALSESQPEREFLSQLRSMHWLDGGNGSQPGVVPPASPSLASLPAFSAQLCFHVTPYQFGAKERPWIRSEILEFCQQMQQCNIETSLKRYFEEEPASLPMHFQLLADFDIDDS